MKKYCKFNHWHFAGRELVKTISRLNFNNLAGAKVLCYSPSALIRRIQQNILTLTLSDYMSYFGDKSLESGFFHQSQVGETIPLSKITFKVFENSSKATSPTKFLLRRYAAFLYAFARIQFGWFRLAFKSQNKSFNNIVIIKSLWAKDVLREHSLSRFLDFCNRFPLENLNESDLILVGLYDFKKEYDQSLEKVHLCNEPFYKLQSFLSISFLESINASFLHLKAFLSFNLLIMRNKKSLLIGDDFAYFSLLEIVKSKGILKEVLLPCSEMSNQPLYLASQQGKNFLTSMIWYSSGIEQYSYKHDPYPTADTYYDFMDIEFAYVWEQESKNELRKYYPSLRDEDVQLTGPLTWTIPPAPIKESSKTLSICIFDQTPLRQSFLAENISGRTCFRYGNIETCQKFLKDTMAALEKAQKKSSKDFKVFLKSKYELTKPKFDPSYKESLEVFIKQGRLEVLPPETDVQEFISRTDLVIVAPFSSPAYIATKMNKEAIFYDSINVLNPDMVFPRDTLAFVSNIDELQSAIEKALNV